MDEKARLACMPEESLSEKFLRNANEVMDKVGIDVNTDKGRRLRAEVIRAYETSVNDMPTFQAYKLPEVVDRNIQSVNSGMYSWLGAFTND